MYGAAQSSVTYDAAGRLTSRVDPKSQQLGYTYNDRNELTRIDYPDPSYVSFAYNDAGARTQMVDGTGTTTYSYDNVYRLTSVAFPGSRTVSYGYDDASRRTSTTYPGGSNQATYAYDNANRLTSVTDWNSHATAYAYDDAGRMTTATLPSGTVIVSTYSYDNADRLTGISHVKNGSTTVASVSYTLDDVGNRTQRVDQAGTHSYSYDDLYRLTSVTYPGPATTSYAFDAFGNRTSMTVGAATTSYSYDDADRITAVTPPSPASAINYTWDDNGDLTARGSDSFSWDYEDRMVSATVSSVTTTFAYRGDGLRNSKTTGGNTTTFTWDVAAGLPVVLDDGSQYLYGPGLVSQKQSGSWYYYLGDGLGSTVAIVDGSGNTQDSYTYDVYGAPTKTGSLANEFDFAGQQTDGSTGLQYLRARYYDPGTGTLTSRDPLASMPRWTEGEFGYVGAKPVNNIDPTSNFCLGSTKLCADKDSVSSAARAVLPYAKACGAWAVAGAIAGGGTGAVAGCAAGAISTGIAAAKDAGYLPGEAAAVAQCLTWGAAAMTGAGGVTAARGLAGCGAALLSEAAGSNPSGQCLAWGLPAVVVGVDIVRHNWGGVLDSIRRIGAGSAAACGAGAFTSPPANTSPIGEYSH